MGESFPSIGESLRAVQDHWVESGLKCLIMAMLLLMMPKISKLLGSFTPTHSKYYAYLKIAIILLGDIKGWVHPAIKYQACQSSMSLLSVLMQILLKKVVGMLMAIPKTEV